MHRWLKRIGLLLASLLGGAPAATAAPPPDPLASASRTTMTGLFREILLDASLRARFAADPAGVMRARGLNPAPFQLPDRLDAARLDRVLQDLADPLAARSAAPAPQRLAMNAQVAVYGPPATPERLMRPPVPPDEPRPPRAEPPVPVYGPPPSPPRSRDRR